MKTNQFKGGTEPPRNSDQRRVTDPKVMAKTIGRDCTEYHKRNPPIFEDATISIHKKGLFWLGAITTI